MHDPFGAAVQFRGHAFRKRGDLGNSHLLTGVDGAV
jgi:hypothetical protein